MSNELPEWVLKNDIPGFLSWDDLKALYHLSSSLPENSVIVEIGSLHGKSSVQLSRSSPTSTVYCFDFWNGGHVKLSPDAPYSRQNTIENFNFFTQNYPNIKPKQITVSPHGAEWGDQLVDMVFIDAEHINPFDWEIIEYWLPKIKKGGILSGHDYFIEFPDVIENVRKLEKMLNQLVTTFNDIGQNGCSVWCFRI